MISEDKIKDAREDSEILVYAFRYALGRRSGASLTTSNYLVKHKERLLPTHIDLILEEILDAIENGCAGDASDVFFWRKAFDELSSYKELKEIK